MFPFFPASKSSKWRRVLVFCLRLSYPPMFPSALGVVIFWSFILDFHGFIWFVHFSTDILFTTVERHNKMQMCCISGPTLPWKENVNMVDVQWGISPQLCSVGGDGFSGNAEVPLSFLMSCSCSRLVSPCIMHGQPTVQPHVQHLLDQKAETSCTNICQRPQLGPCTLRMRQTCSGSKCFSFFSPGRRTLPAASSSSFLMGWWWPQCQQRFSATRSCQTLFPTQNTSQVWNHAPPYALLYHGLSETSSSTIPQSHIHKLSWWPPGLTHGCVCLRKLSLVMFIFTLSDGRV